MDAMEQATKGAWMHSFEEDTGNELVFRPASSYPFPASRRPRDTLDFDTGQLVRAVPGPDDKLQRTPGAITPLGMRRYRLDDGREIEVIDADSTILRVRMGG
jgi:hypothetical protein